MINMSTPAKRAISFFLPSLLLLFCFPQKSAAQAFDLASLGIDALGGGAGYLIGKSIAPHNAGIQAATTGLGVIVTQLGQTAFTHKTNNDKLDSFIAGQDYQRWITTEKHWYDLTLDPTLPEAFSGLNYGAANQKPGPRQNDSQKSPDGSDQLQEQTPYNPVIVNEGTYNGTYRTKRVLWFPTLGD